MVGELIMLPVRVGVRATRLWFRAVEETVWVTTSAAGRVIEVFASRSSGGAAQVAQPHQEPLRPAPAPEPVHDVQFEPDGETGPIAEPAAADTAPLTEPLAEPAIETPPIAEPRHVSEEPTLVEEFAEPGAEDGAGAEVHVDPPWDGYDQMNAKQITARLAGADAAELAAVELYEVTNRRRQTILNAVGRELRRVNGSGRRGNQAQRG